MNKNIIIPLLCQCGLFIHTCLKIQLCLKIWFSTFFDITWYAEAAICKKSSFVSFSSFLVKFSQWDRGSDRVKLTVWQSPMGWKMPLCNWHTFWMAPCLICYFIVILFYIERKWLLLRNLARILPLKSKLSGKFQCFNAIDGGIKILKKSWIYKNFN